jgi:N-succinyldiaminopimelate aminotransferase
MTSDVRPLGYADGVEFCRDLPERCGVVAIPHQVFYDRVDAGRPYVRWAFCKADAVLDEAITRLGRLNEARDRALSDARVQTPMDFPEPLGEVTHPVGRQG